jgi:hypothetical protein
VTTTTSFKPGPSPLTDFLNGCRLLQAPNPDQKRKKCEEEGEEGARLIFVFPLRKPKYYHLSYKKNSNSSKKKVRNEDVEQKKTTMTIR